ncbi:MAG: hypothetical protein MJ237_09465 [bacterium]|nr:hypothetical protein [bacterium]
MPDKNYDKEYSQMLKFVLAREGGYSNNKDDLGGETNKGITHTTYDSYRRSKGLPTQSVKYITEDEMQEIYYNNYYKASGADKIDNPRLSMYVFDTAVNMGVSVAKDLYKKAVIILRNLNNLDEINIIPMLKLILRKRNGCKVGKIELRM